MGGARTRLRRAQATTRNTHAGTDHVPNEEISKPRIHLNVEMGAPTD